MESIEIKKEMQMGYNELVDYLLKKYGPSKYDYFCNENCKSKNQKVSRTDEGLICHHIDEDKAIKLSEDKYASMNPYEYQKADRLVYCNILEHLVLHVKIVEEPRNIDANKDEFQGIGGVLAFMCPQINDYYNGYIFKKQYLINIYNQVENNFEDYIYILKYLLEVVSDKTYGVLITKGLLSLGWDGQIVDKVYKRL